MGLIPLIPGKRDHPGGVPSQEIIMADHDRIEGSAKQAEGSIKEGLSKLTGDEKLKAEGRADKVEGKVQNAIGGVKDTLKGDGHN
jgi:uncharacterized protein YjbJ (UPF0337 family)